METKNQNLYHAWVLFESIEPSTGDNKPMPVDQQCLSSSLLTVEWYSQDGHEGSANKAIVQALNSLNNQRIYIRWENSEADTKLDGQKLSTANLKMIHQSFIIMLHFYKRGVV